MSCSWPSVIFYSGGVTSKLMIKKMKARGRVHSWDPPIIASKRTLRRCLLLFQGIWSRCPFLIPTTLIYVTFLRHMRSSGMLSNQECWQEGQVLLLALNRCMTDCKIDANGVTPMPAPINTACSAWKIALVGVPYGPSIYTCMDSKWSKIYEV